MQVCTCACVRRVGQAVILSLDLALAALPAESCRCLDGESSMVSPICMGFGTLLSPP